MAISDKLTTLNGIKSDIKTAINGKGGSVGDDFTTYATAISNLPSGGGDEVLRDLIEGDISGSFEIPDGTTTIKYGTFHSCSNLTSVTIPSSVRTIGSYAFYNCNGLTSITSLNTTPPTLGTNVFFNVPATCPIYVPSASVNAYKAAANWSSRAKYIQPIQ